MSSIKFYPSGEYRITERVHVSVVFEHGRVLSSPNSLVSMLACHDFYMSTHWAPYEVQYADVQIINRLANLTEFKMSKQNKFVMNNLSDKQLEALDKSYPDLPALQAVIDVMVADHDFSLAIRLDKNGSYIAFCNQGDYVVSGRSGNSLDALVIAVYKCQCLDLDLSKGAVEDTKPKRG